MLSSRAREVAFMRSPTTILLALLSTSACESPLEYDVLIVNGTVLDGTGAPGARADVAVANGVIAAVGSLEGARAKRVLEAQARIVSPGFIDMMGGSSLPLAADPPSAESKLRQGITTMMAGEGGSLAPQNERTFAELARGDLDWKWNRFDEYFRLLESKGIALNVVHNAGAEQVRRIVLGDEDVAPTPSQLQEMKGLVEQAMKDGAAGLSTSLIYPPGAYAGTEEIIELAKAAAAQGGVYFTHMRNESGGLLEAIDEALRVGREAGIPVHIYHLKAAGQENWPLMESALSRIRAAIAGGMDVTADIYPYIRNGIGLGSFLHPRHYAKGEEAFLATLSNPKVRAGLRQEVEETSDWENWYRHVGKDWGNVLITEVGPDSDPEVVGLSIEEAAEHMGKDVWDAFFDLVAAGGTGVCPESMDEAQKHLAMKEPFVVFDNDTRPTNPRSVVSAHPRGFGAFPRILAKYVREEKVIALPEAIRRLTSLPAAILRLPRRGRIEPGYAADVIVFDPEGIRDTATFTEPLSYSVGIDHVLVNGVPVILEGEMTGGLPGKVLRHRP
jgi:N-acyl-D-aspartate/D-glutamate deacylase